MKGAARRGPPPATRIVGFLALFLGCFAAPAIAEEQADRPETLTVVTGSHGGTYFVFGTGFGEMIAEALALPAEVEITGGPVENVALAEAGDDVLGFATLGPADEARRGESPVMPGITHLKVRALFPMYQTPLQAAVPVSSDIRSVDDLAGKRVGLGPLGGTSAAYWPRYFNATDMDVALSYAGGDESAEQLKAGEIDAFLFAAGVPTQAYSQLSEEVGLHFLPLDGDAAATMRAIAPAMSDFALPADTYRGQSEPVPTLSLWNFAIANAGMSETLAYALTKLAMENNQRLVDIHPSAREALPENVIYNTVIPFHPGAVRWFNENGYEIPQALQ